MINKKFKQFEKLQMAVNMSDRYNIGYFSKISHLETCFCFLIICFVGKKVNNYIINNAYGTVMQIFNIYTNMAVKIIPKMANIK